MNRPPPAQIGRYPVLRELARGAHGVVYRARDPSLDREVAIKLFPAAAHDRGAWLRFEREAKSLAQIQHPHLVALHELGDHQGCPYLVMDLVQGQSLQQRLDRGGCLEPFEAARLVRRVAGALVCAHERGILHRDLKPDNVLLDAQGNPRLTDFGLAGLLHQDPTQSRVTVEGGVLGTPGYWAPEQALGQLERVGPATDVFGLGALLYACLTGRPPFSGATLMAVLDATASGAITPLGQLRPDAPPRLREICQRCLAPRPEDRFPTAAAAERELEAFLRDPGQAASWGRWALVGGLLVVGTLVAGLLLARAGPERATPPVTASPDSPPAVVVSPSSPPTPDRALGSPPTPSGDAPPEQRLDPELERLGESGRRAIKELRYEDAVRIYDVLLVRAPHHMPFWANRGASYQQLVRLEEALRDYDEAIRLDPGLGPYFNRARVRDKMSDTEGALEDFAAALEQGRYPAYIVLLYRGEVYSKQGQPERAFADFSRSLELKPSFVDVHLKRADALHRIDRFAEARAELIRFLRVAEPDHFDREDAERKLRLLQQRR